MNTLKTKKMIEVEGKNGLLIAKFTSEDRFNALITEPVKEQLLGYYASPGTKLIMNLEGIKFIDSSGFAVLLTLLKAANNSNGSFRICNLATDVKELFQVLQLHHVFDIHGSVEDCIASFNE
jgi:anti-sigma B factor antagonist